MAGTDEPVGGQESPAEVCPLCELGADVGVTVHGGCPHEQRAEPDQPDTAELRRHHYPRKDGHGSCVRCYPWEHVEGGCEVQRSAAALDAARAQVATLTAELEATSTPCGHPKKIKAIHVSPIRAALDGGTDG